MIWEWKECEVAVIKEGKNVDGEVQENNNVLQSNSG